MKTKLIALALLISAMFMFAGCDTSGMANTTNPTVNTPVQTNPETALSDRMEFLCRDYCSYSEFYYYRDVYTDVVYVLAYRASGYGSGGSFTPILNADGTPILWSEIKDRNIYPFQEVEEK